MSIRQVQPYERFPSGDYRDLLEVPLSPEDLSGRYDLKFLEDYDGLDWYRLAAIELPDGTQAWFMKYRGEREGGTVVRVDTGTSPAMAKKFLLEALRLREKDLLWVTPLLLT